MHRSARGVVLSIGVLAVAGLVGCGGGGDSGGSPAAAGTASDQAPETTTIVVRNDVDTFDPYKSVLEAGAKQMFEGIYDTLTRDGPDNTVEPALAESWKTTLTSGTFTLKEGLTCADGSPLTAKDVAASLRYLSDPKTGSQLTNRIFGPGGVKAITADNEARTVKITVKKPHPDLLASMRFSFIICPKGLADLKGLAVSPKGAESGPYRLTTLKRDDTYVLERRDDAALPDPAALPKTVTLRVVADDTTRANLVDTGEVDIAGIIGRDATRLSKQSEPIKGLGYLADSLLFNQAKGHPGTDAALRRALGQAIDAQAYNRAATFDVADPVDTQYTPGMDCYTEENGQYTPAFDVEKAKADLAAAGYGPGKKPLTLRLVGYDAQNSGPDYVADALRKTGIDVKVTNGTLEQLIGIVFGGKDDWDVMVFPFVSASNLPYAMVNQISDAFGEGGLNPGDVHNAEYDRLVLEASRTEGPRRCELWSEAEQALLKSGDVKPLSIPTTAWFQSSGLTFQSTNTEINLRSIRKTN